ncbi:MULTISPECIES: hypothetical protein [Enterobacter cloacae complex]|uniref:Ead/Ea22-like family protein n=1 Tax=Enterobacter roggenkampii TaxID=1812935 RepID=A0A837LFG9_9ENTR|nr:MULTISPECIES: hypothetical protein [Enterobacter cloacae complex]KLP99015.1 hypothetical protein ABF77_16445 [Enterobacter roggenkampii]MCK6990166.1 hypothetical protein [Enterobacter asburiae]
MSNKYEDLIKNARMNADCGEHMSPAEVTTLLNVVEITFAALAAENAGLKAALNPEVIPEVAVEAFTETVIMDHDWNETSEWSWVENDTDVIRAVLEAIKPETPATDAFLAEVRAHARNEGINYAAGRLAAAFNHGFVDKPLAEVFDVVRMILTTKEDLANDPLPATDGLSGEYAEKFLAEFAANLRKGVQS